MNAAFGVLSIVPTPVTRSNLSVDCIFSVMSGAPRSWLETAPHRLFLLSPGVQSAIAGPLWGNDFTQVVQETVGVGKGFPDFQLWSMNFHFHRVKESC